MQTETYTSLKYLLLCFHFYLLKKYFVFLSVMAMYKNYFKSLIINKKIFLLMFMMRYSGCAGVAVTSCKLANGNTWPFKFFMRRCYRIRGSLNSAETKLSNGVNSHCFGIRGEPLHLKSCLCDVLLMPLIRLEKRRRRTTSTGCKCQSGWKAGQLENNPDVGEVEGKNPFSKLSSYEKTVFKQM